MCNLQPASHMPGNSLSFLFFLLLFPSLVVPGVNLLNNLLILDTVDVLVGAGKQQRCRSVRGAREEGWKSDVDT